ncbi:MAG: cation-efflux pump [Clostridiales bacterium]|nr:MAG: cation-efflux pump [Clostridiales bacterium]
MISLLAKIFIKNRDGESPETLRLRYGVLCGAFGIFLNLMLFVGKLVAGMLSGSISVTADAFNNLSDAGSSLITLVGFRIAGHKADSHHPFGHGRFEYISGLLVSILIILVGFELGKSSVEKLFAPEPVVFSALTLSILAVSVAVKLYMAFYNKRIGKKLDSPAMEATAVDSLSDAASTFVVFICMLLSHFFEWEIDAWCGLAVSGFILVSGIRSAKQTIDPLLGQPPSAELVGRIESIVRSHPYVVGIHDLVVHDYGPGRLMISLHAEVPADGDLLKIHDSIDNAEKELNHALCCEAVIHMDPVETDDARTNETKEKIAALVRTLDPRITIHDFRMVSGETHTNVIFDAVVPFDVSLDEKEVAARISELVSALDGNYYAVVNIDKAVVK